MTRRLTVAAAIAAALAVALAAGCAAPSKHKITPGSTKILEIEVPGGEAKDEGGRMKDKGGTRHQASGTGEGTERAEPSAQCLVPSASVPVLGLPELVVLAAVGVQADAQPERPETMAEVEIDGKRFRVPGGTKFRYVESQGAGLESTSDEIAADWRAEAPTASTGLSAASGGGLESAVKLTRLRSSPALVVAVFGCLVIVGGVAAGFLVSWKLGGPLILAGGGMLLAAYLMTDPVLMLGLVLLAAAAGLAYVLWRAREGRLDAEALAIVTGAVEKAAGADRGAILSDVKSRMGDRRHVLDKAVRRAKRRAGVA